MLNSYLNFLSQAQAVTLLAAFLIGGDLMRESERYRELAAQVIDEHSELAFLKRCRIGFLSSDKEKHKAGGTLVLGDCRKVSETYSCFVPYDMLITIYEPNCTELTDDQLKILLHHELLHIDFAESKDGELVWKTRPHDVEDFRRIIGEHGIDWAVV